MKTTRQEQLADHFTEIDENLLHTAYEIDDAEKLADYRSRRSTPFYQTPRFRRWTALAVCLAVTVTAAVTLPAAFAHESTTDAVVSPAPDTAPESNQIVLPPVRVGASVMAPSFHHQVSTIEKLCEIVEAIAVIRVGNWLGEGEFHTYYDAEVLQLVSGTLPDQFILMQSGNSKYTYKGYPLYVLGDEFLVFLMKATDSPEEDNVYPNDNSYWIAGAYTTAMEVIKGEKGDYYFIDRYYLVDRSILELTDLKADEAAYSAIYKSIPATDIDTIRKHPTQHAIYSLSELIPKLPPLSHIPFPS